MDPKVPLPPPELRNGLRTASQRPRSRRRAASADAGAAALEKPQKVRKLRTAGGAVQERLSVANEMLDVITRASAQRSITHDRAASVVMTWARVRRELLEYERESGKKKQQVDPKTGEKTAINPLKRIAALTGVSYGTVHAIVRMFRQALESRSQAELLAMPQDDLRNLVLYTSGMRGGRGREKLRRIRTRKQTYYAIRDFVREQRAERRRVTAIQVLQFLLEETEGVLEVKKDPKQPDGFDKKDKVAALQALRAFLRRWGFVSGKKNADGGLSDKHKLVRRQYLAAMAANRRLPPEERLLEVYLDESYVQHNYKQTEYSLYDPNDKHDKSGKYKTHGQRYYFAAAIIGDDPTDITSKARLLTDTIWVFQGGQREQCVTNRNKLISEWKRVKAELDGKELSSLSVDQLNGHLKAVEVPVQYKDKKVDMVRKLRQRLAVDIEYQLPTAVENENAERLAELAKLREEFEDESRIEKLKVKELKAIIKRVGVPNYGRKLELIERLRNVRNGALSVVKPVQSKKEPSGYHRMFAAESFTEWWTRQLLPSLPEGRRCLIIMDNAAYHKCLPPSTPRNFSKVKKAQAVEYLIQYNGIKGEEEQKQFRESRKQTKRADVLQELRGLVNGTVKPLLVQLAEEQGHRVLFTPLYHSDLQPIELVWARVKGKIGRAYHKDKTLEEEGKELRDALAALGDGRENAEVGKIIHLVDKELHKHLDAEFPGWNLEDYSLPTEEQLDDEEEEEGVWAEEPRGGSDGEDEEGVWEDE